MAYMYLFSVVFHSQGHSTEIEPALRFLSNFVYWLFILKEFKFWNKNEGSPSSFRSNSTLVIPHKPTYNSTMIIVTIACYTFPMIVSCSILRIGPYLFYIKKLFTQFKTTEKKWYVTILIFEKMTIYPFGEVQPQRKSHHFLKHAHWSRLKLCTVEMRNAILRKALIRPA